VKTLALAFAIGGGFGDERVRTVQSVPCLL
jgi:hypothetical protein